MPARYFSSARALSDFVTGTAARGRIVAPELRNITNGAYFDLSDGVNPTVRFHFDRSGSYTPGGGYNATNVRLNVSGAASRGDVATTLRTSINGVGAGLAITASAIPVGGWEMALVNDQVGEIGNVLITSSNLPFDMVIAGMSDGAGPIDAASFIDIVPAGNQFVLFYRS